MSKYTNEVTFKVLYNQVLYSCVLLSIPTSISIFPQKVKVIYRYNVLEIKE